MLRDIFYEDINDKKNAKAKVLSGFDMDDLHPYELGILSTYVDPEKIDHDERNNPYLEELCKRFGNDKDFKSDNEENRRGAVKTACSYFGFCLGKYS